MTTKEPDELTLDEEPIETDEDIDPDIEDLEDQDDEDLDETLDEDLDEDADLETAEGGGYDSEDDDDEDEETAEALEELESEELKLLDDEASEALLVDEVKELRAIRREELTMDVDAQVQRSDEFVCQSCFLVKRTSQLANRRKMLCADCAT
jgi:hypothetical protein